MYLAHYGLSNKPFSISPDPDFLWLGEKHAEALAGLEYGIQENKGFLLLTGEIGTGKTVLINSFIKLINKKVIIANIQDPRLELIEFYNILAYKLKIKRRFERKGDFLVYFEKFLIQTYRHGKKVLLIIDEAQRLKNELLDEIRVLSNIELDNRKLINIFFVGQTELKKVLLEERNRPLKQRITYNYHLNPLIEQETASFIEHRLKIAGASGKFFTEEAICEIHNFSQGSPRLINIICDHCLITGYSAGIKIINASVVIECAKELQISLDTSPPPSKQTTAIEYDSHSKQQQNIKYIRRSEPSNKAAILKVVGIGAIVLIIFGITASFYFTSRIEQSANLSKHDSEILISEESKEKLKKPLVKIANSEANKEDVLPDKFSVEKIQSDKNVEKTFTEERSDNTIDEFKTATVLKNEAENFNSDNALDLPVEIANSEVDKEDALPDKFSVEKIQSDKNVEKTFTEERSDNVIEEVRPATISKTDAAKINLRKNELSDQRNLAISDVKKSVVEGDDQDAKSPNAKQALILSEKKFLIHFKHNSADLDARAFEKLKKITELLSQNSVSEIIIEGYTDSYGNDNYNKTLSQLRSNVVKSYIISQGFAKSSIKAIGLGSEKPIGENTTRNGKSKNRRVEIKVKIGANGN